VKEDSVGHPYRPFLAAGALLLAIAVAPPVAAGGAHVRVEGPDLDGRTYTVRTFDCPDPASVALLVRAEFGEDGRRTVALPLVSGDRPGVFHFTRTWPAGQRWMLRVSSLQTPMPVALVIVDRRGRVLRTDQVFEGDGLRECDAMLAPPRGRAASRRGVVDDDC